MKKILSVFKILLISFVAFGSQVYAKTIIKLGHYNSDTHSSNIALNEYFKKTVEEKTDGRYEIRIFPNNQLGGEDQIVNGLRNGTIEMGITGLLLQNVDPLFGVWEWPYLFKDNLEARKVFESPVAKEIGIKMEKYGIKLLAYGMNGLGYVAIISGLIFAGLSGSAVADTAALGAILIPMMVARKYNAARSTGLICAAGIVSVVIPPSIPVIVYGITAGVSITKLFMGGVAPGLLMVAGLWFAWKLLYRNEDDSVFEKQTGAQRWQAFKAAFLPLLLPVIIIVGLRGGIFTPTEAGVVAAIYAAGVSVYYRSLPLEKLSEVFISTIKTTSMVMFVAAAAMISGFAVTVAQIPAELVSFIRELTDNTTVLMLVIMIFLLLIGCVMDLIPAVLIFVPVLLPLLRAYHIDIAYFGVMMVINLSIGLITPPIGTVLYVGSGISKQGIGQLTKGIIPFLAVYFVILILLTLFPQIVITPMNWLSQ